MRIKETERSHVNSSIKIRFGAQLCFYSVVRKVNKIFMY